MFRFLGQARPSGVRRTRLSLETLNDRSLPSANPIDEPPDFMFADAPPAPPVELQILDFGGEEVAFGWYLFTGRVIAPNPEGITVYLGGAPVSLQGVTATVDEDGEFAVLVSLATDGSDDGTATAVFSVNGQQSNVAMDMISPSRR